MKKLLAVVSASLIGLMPTSFIFAAVMNEFNGSLVNGARGTNNFAHLVGIVIGMVKSLVPLVIALSLLYFSWGLFQLVKSSNEGSREEAVKMMTFGIIALFVMVGVWGLVNVLTSTFFSGNLAIPQLK